MRWFTSDTHFGHSNILKYEAEMRPFGDTNHMDEFIINGWNAMVAPDDEVIHLGDVAMGQISVSLPKVGRLNGRKILVPGNHDRVFSGVKIGMAERFMPEYLAVFDEVWPEQTTLALACDITVNLCHFPYQGDHTIEERYSDKRPVDNGLPLVHGHVHSMWQTNGRQFNVGIDANGLLPVSEDTIIDWVRSL